MSTAPKILRFVLRLPEDLHAALATLATREGRSLHGQIIYLLRKALSDGTPES